MSDTLRIGSWVRIDDGTYRVGQIRGTGYGAEVAVITAPYGQVVTTDKVTPVPAPGEPRGDLYPVLPAAPRWAIPEVPKQ
jgi:hypothetical protein